MADKNTLVYAAFCITFKFPLSLSFATSGNCAVKWLYQDISSKNNRTVFLHIFFLTFDLKWLFAYSSDYFDQQICCTCADGINVLSVNRFIQHKRKKKPPRHQHTHTQVQQLANIQQCSILGLTDTSHNLIPSPGLFHGSITN